MAPPTNGALQVTTSTSGTEPDPDGYTVQVDAEPPQPIGGSATLDLPDVAAGTHTVQLAGMAANCTVEGDNPRGVTVLAGGTTTVEFVITCNAATAGLQVTSTTSGIAPDPDGYSVLVDGADRGMLAATGTLSVPGVVPGLHEVGLSGVAANCTVQGSNPQTVTVNAGESATVTFAISCGEAPASAGTLTVATTTSGGNTLDPNGYLFAIDGGTPQPIPTNGLATVANLSAGVHSVFLSDLAANCDVRDENPRSIEIAAGATATLNFITICSPVIGSIEVTTQTSGSNPDPDGYTLSIDAGAPQSIASNTTVTLEGIAPGTHALTLAGIAGNCHLEGDNPRQVDVPRRTVATVTFVVTCAASTGTPPIVFASSTPDFFAVALVNPDGTGFTQLTDGLDPVWSPDGRRILFATLSDLRVMNSDGSDQTILVQGSVFQHRWSPNGRLIAYVSQRGEGQDIIEELWVMQADGSGKTKLADNASHPTWSPDAQRIAYASFSDLLDQHIRIIGASGSGDSRLTGQGVQASEPAWSPDGRRIAFRADDKDIFLINPDGSAPVNLTQGAGGDDGPTWSPDGNRILFVTEHAGQPGSGIAVMNRDGTNRLELTNNPALDIMPAWSSDGGRIVFVRSDGIHLKLYVMDANGSHQANISNSPDSDDISPNWRGQGSAMVASRVLPGRPSLLRVPDFRSRRTVKDLILH